MSAGFAPGLRDSMMRDGYTRQPETVVAWHEVETGPPLRELVWPTAGQRVSGQFSWRHADGAVFEAWVRDTLNHGRDPFDWTLRDHPAPRGVTARFLRLPVRAGATASRRVYSAEILVEPPAPQPAALSALAALHKAAPASWPASLPAFPLRAGYTAEPADPVLRAPEGAPPGGRLSTRNAGLTEDAAFALTPAALEAFEAWFATDAAFGARDIAWPVAGGTRPGCFASGYSVAAQPGSPRFLVRFKRYLEAVS